MPSLQARNPHEEAEHPADHHHRRPLPPLPLVLPLRARRAPRLLERHLSVSPQENTQVNRI